MLAVFGFNVVDFRMIDNSSASWTLLILWDLVNNFATELILFNFSLHKPVTIKTLEVVFVKAGINSD